MFGLTTTTTGADVYLSLGFALHCHKLHDKDGDQVSDKLDKCPKVKGSWELQDCPGTDGDGIPDKLDACLTVAGPAEKRGYP